MPHARTPIPRVNLKELKTRPHTGFMSMGDILPEVRNILPKYRRSFTSCERAGNCQGVEPKLKRGKLFCIKLDYNSIQYVMLPDGTVTICCMDYGMRHRIGNLLETHYDELYNSPEMQRILTSASSSADAYALCRTCNSAFHRVPMIRDKARMMAVQTTERTISKMLQHLHLLGYIKRYLYG
jgi:radical SAM protein with 4Fe4S-binding SPASM domain